MPITLAAVTHSVVMHTHLCKATWGHAAALPSLLFPSSTCSLLPYLAFVGSQLLFCTEGRGHLIFNFLFLLLPAFLKWAFLHITKVCKSHPAQVLKAPLVPHPSHPCFTPSVSLQPSFHSVSKHAASLCIWGMVPQSAVLLRSLRTWQKLLCLLVLFYGLRDWIRASW